MSTFSESAATALQLILSSDPVLLAIVGRSLAVSASACAIACVLGLALGAWLGVASFPGRDGVLTLLNTLLAVPSVVVGLVVYLLLSRSGPLGHLGWLFNFQAMVLAQTLLVLPVATALTRQVIEDERARTLFNLHPRDLNRPLQDLEISYRPVELRSCIDQVKSDRRIVTLKKIIIVQIDKFK